MRFNEELEKIKIYEAGKPIELVVREYGIKPEQIVKLASNENPYGCSPKVQEAVRAVVKNMAIYPDDSMYVLKDALARRFDVGADNLIIGAGSDQVIEFAIHAKASKTAPILTNGITFAMYGIYAAHIGAQVIKTTSQEHDLEEFYELYKAHNPSIVFLCTPNNPTGDALDAEAVFRFIEKIDDDTLVVVDGAYMEYASYKDAKKSIDVQKLITTFANVLYLGTFSKAYGLGGMRVGYGIASEPIIEALYKLRPPFNITTLSLEAASVALEESAFVRQSVADNFEQMARYERFLSERGFDYIESYTNFITIPFAHHNSSEFAQKLLERGMIVRDLAGYNLNAVRVTVGTQMQNDRFFELFDELR